MKHMLSCCSTDIAVSVILHAQHLDVVELYSTRLNVFSREVMPKTRFGWLMLLVLLLLLLL
jgi:hypothetical protein